MAMKPEEALELVKFLNLDEAENLETAKEKFQQHWMAQKEHDATLGKLNGSIAHVVKKAFEPFGVSLTEDDFKDAKSLDVIRNAAERAKTEYEKQREEWEKKATGNGAAELVAEWEKKHKTLERKYNEVEQARQEALTQFESYKTQAAEEKKAIKITSVFERELGALKLDPTVNEYTIKGFKSAINEKYLIDLEDDGSAVVKDRKTGERLKSKDKAGAFLGVNDVLISEATAAGIIQKNPHAGKPLNRQGAAILPPLESQAEKRIKGVNPRFFVK
jgi:hypothetical protein